MSVSGMWNTRIGATREGMGEGEEILILSVGLGEGEGDRTTILISLSALYS